LFLLLIFSGCGSDKILPKADVQIDISDLVYKGYDVVEEVWVYVFNILLSEHHGVRVTVNELKVEIFYQEVFLDGVVRTSIGDILPNSTFPYPYELVTAEHFDSMTVTVKDQDFNGYSILVSNTFFNL